MSSPKIQPSTLKFGRLTKRENDVYQLRERGFSGRAIARQLGISPETVKIHVGHIIDKGFSTGKRGRKMWPTIDVVAVLKLLLDSNTDKYAVIQGMGRRLGVEDDVLDAGIGWATRLVEEHERR